MLIKDASFKICSFEVKSLGREKIWEIVQVFFHNVLVFTVLAITLVISDGF